VQWMIEIKATINLWLWPGAMLLAWSIGEYLFKRLGLPAHKQLHRTRPSSQQRAHGFNHTANQQLNFYFSLYFNHLERNFER